MSDYIDSVNDIIALLERSKIAHKQADEHQKAAERARLESELRAFLKDYQDLEKLTRPIPTDGDDDLSDLPPELLKELSVTKTDDLENQIATVINAAGGSADIDKILIHLFRRFKVTQTRKFLQNKLWRMTNKGILFSVPRKKGHYSTRPLESDDDWVEEEMAKSITDDDIAEARSPHAFNLPEEDGDEIPF